MHQIQGSVKSSGCFEFYSNFFPIEIKRCESLKRLKQKHTSVFSEFVLHPPVETLACAATRE